jgi:outer membrane murein-binding lipoprotein Lpp
MKIWHRSLGPPVAHASDRLRVAFIRRLGAVLLLGALASGCPTPETPYDKASDAARELNMAARWGRMDVAQGRTSAAAAESFSKRHAAWHDKVRIVDTELMDLKMDGPLHAVADVEISWTFSDDPTLRVTRISQKWTGSTGRWLLASERRVSGDKGLYGDKVKREEKTEDTHFPTKVIR